jgi:hypothetical protein
MDFLIMQMKNFFKNKIKKKKNKKLKNNFFLTYNNKLGDLNPQYEAYFNNINKF